MESPLLPPGWTGRREICQEFQKFHEVGSVVTLPSRGDTRRVKVFLGNRVVAETLIAKGTFQIGGESVVVKPAYATDVAVRDRAVVKDGAEREEAGRAAGPIILSPELEKMQRAAWKDEDKNRAYRRKVQTGEIKPNQRKVPRPAKVAGEKAGPTPEPGQLVEERDKNAVAAGPLGLAKQPHQVVEEVRKLLR